MMKNVGNTLISYISSAKKEKSWCICRFSDEVSGAGPLL